MRGRVLRGTLRRYDTEYLKKIHGQPKRPDLVCSDRVACQKAQLCRSKAKAMNLKSSSSGSASTSSRCTGLYTLRRLWRRAMARRSFFLLQCIKGRNLGRLPDQRNRMHNLAVENTENDFQYQADFGIDRGGYPKLLEQDNLQGGCSAWSE